MGRFCDITGNRYGMLTAIKPMGERDPSGAVVWEFVCDCGKHKAISSNPVKCGRVKSCGCAYRTHAMTGTRLYDIWVNMRQRCSNPKYTGFKWWGGKGVSVCEEWDNSFNAFSAWAMSSGYKDNLTIDRIDGNGNYTPNNCRWATYSQQARNTSRNRKITAFGKTMLLCEWEELTGFSQYMIALRIDRYGFTPERALTKKPRASKAEIEEAKRRWDEDA